MFENIFGKIPQKYIFSDPSLTCVRLYIKIWEWVGVKLFWFYVYVAVDFSPITKFLTCVVYRKISISFIGAYHEIGQYYLLYKCTMDINSKYWLVLSHSLLKWTLMSKKGITYQLKIFHYWSYYILNFHFEFLLIFYHDRYWLKYLLTK